MTVKHLGYTDFNVIIECFLYSFEGYFVKMPTDPNYYKQRWKSAKVRYDLSYGMFHEERLVGFIINALDKRYGDYIAFNTGTGVIPEYRGKKIVKSIYNYAIPDLIKNGVTKCSLEVIVENEKAIKAYKSIGFNISKHYKCYNGTINVKENNFTLKEITFKDIDWNSLPNQDSYSWDFRKNCLINTNYKFYQVFNKLTLASYFIINPETGSLAQWDVIEDSNKNWNMLFSAINSITNNIKINNVDDRLIEKISTVESVGLQNSVNQFEMQLDLKIK